MSKLSNYSPTSYFFNVKKWTKQLSQEQKSDPNFYEAGLIIGALLLEVDEKYQALLKEHGQVSPYEMMYFQQHATIHYYSSLSDSDSVSDKEYEIRLEAITDGTRLIINTSKPQIEKRKTTEVYYSLLELAAKRLYLQEAWERVKNKRFILAHTPLNIEFISSNQELDLGEKIAISRFKDHLGQIAYEARSRKLHFDIDIIYIPFQVHPSREGLAMEFCHPDEDLYLQIHMNWSQIPFFYKRLAKISFLNYPELTILDLSYSWIIFSRLAGEMVKSELTNQTGLSYQTFAKEALIDLLCHCIDMTFSKAEQMVEMLSSVNPKAKEKAEDFYIKPILKIKNEYFLSLPALISGQFTRVVDYYLDRELLQKDKKIRKGKFFETDFAELLQEQISENPLLNSGFCKVLKISYEQPKGKKNEEIDIILRIGETYLLIEAKSFVYRVGNVGFHNNYNEINDSNFPQKKEFFLEDYKDFRTKYDPFAKFDLNPKKVLCCYLTSSPHCVGMKVHDVPVVDSSILERYFGNGFFTVIDEQRQYRNFVFYRNFDQAEKNLLKYLQEQPQLLKYKNTLKYSDVNLGEYRGKQVIFKDAFFDLSIKNEIEIANYLIELADDWHKVARPS